MATVINQPNPIAALLEPFNRLADYRMQQNLADQERNKRMGQTILQQALTNPDIARFLATAEAEPFLREMGLDQNPNIKTLVEQGQAANAPLMEPTPTEIGGPGSPMVNIPKPTPSGKQVENQILAENVQRQYAATQATKQMEANIELMKSYTLHVMQDAYNKGQNLTPEQLFSQVEKFKKSLPGTTPYRTKIVMDPRGQPTVTLEQETQSEALGNRRTLILNQKDYETPRTALAIHIQQGKKEVGAILRGDIEALNAFGVDSGLDPKAVAIIQSVTAQKKKNPTMSPADSAELYIKAINDAVAEQKKSLLRLGGTAGVPSEQLVADQEAFQPITFEDVAGMTRDEWDKKSKGAALPTADKILKDVSDQAKASKQSGPDVQPRPAEGKAQSQGEKIKGLYDEVSGIVSQARSKNPGLSADGVVQIVRSVKTDLMRQYGLNEKEYELFESMVKNAANKK